MTEPIELTTRDLGVRVETYEYRREYRVFAVDGLGSEAIVIEEDGKFMASFLGWNVPISRERHDSIAAALDELRALVKK